MLCLCLPPPPPPDSCYACPPHPCRMLCLRLCLAQVRERDWCNVVTGHEGDPVAYIWRLQHFTLGEHQLLPPKEELAGGGWGWGVGVCVKGARIRVQEENQSRKTLSLWVVGWVVGKKNCSGPTPLTPGY